MSALAIPRDRFFLDGICTHLLAFQDDGHVEWTGDYEADESRRLMPDSGEPKRIRYEKFAR